MQGTVLPKRLSGRVVLANYPIFAF